MLKYVKQLEILKYAYRRDLHSKRNENYLKMNNNNNTTYQNLWV